MNALEDRSAPVVLTPEHVPIRLFPAGLGARFLALMIDTAINWGVCITVALLIGSLSPHSSRVGAAIDPSWSDRSSRTSPIHRAARGYSR